MTTHQAKQDAAARLQKAGITYGNLTAKTVSFEGFGYGRSVFVSIHNATVPPDWKAIFADLPKPSEGGYVPELGSNCKNLNGQVIMFR